MSVAWTVVTTVAKMVVWLADHWAVWKDVSKGEMRVGTMVAPLESQ